MDSKKRLDVLLVSRKIAETRTRAKRMITGGNVYVNGRRSMKPGALFTEDAEIEFRGEEMKYVSRGGYKLEKALNVWKPDLHGRICMDVGSSTGGFTDCMLQNGAEKVYSVDSGTGQLSDKLRCDSRVVVMEQTNVRNLTPENVPQEIDFISIDVSFISLSKVLGPVSRILKPGGQAVCLIKPQFEAGRGNVGKKGVVRDPGIHRQVIMKVAGYAYENGFLIRGTDYSPIKGPEGNIEYLMFLEKKKPEESAPVNSYSYEASGGRKDEKNLLRTEELVSRVVKKAHSDLSE